MAQAQGISPLQAWLMATRPKTLPAAIAPVTVGIGLALADGVFSLLPSVAALITALLLQIGANLANDYLDYVKGADIDGRTGPTRVAQSGLIPLSHLRLGITITFALALLVGAYLVSLGGWPILVLGIASILSAWAYTGGPYPLGYHGLGDLSVFVFFGLTAVSGTYYVQAQALKWLLFASAVPVGLLTVAILVVNNLRDLRTDRQAGKRTLAVLIGPRATRIEYTVLLIGAYAVPAFLAAARWSSPWVALSWLTLPLALPLVHAIHSGLEGQALNRVLAGTARLDLLFSLLFALGLVL
jgi:1,4-dihydroxy-2-naphthoate octaprenyltransferase